MAEDRGVLRKAIKNSDGWYKLSEHGEGRKPLVVIGSRAQVLQFFKHNGASGIENSIPKLPHIYMGISRYAPREQYRKVTPFNDIVLPTVNVAVSAVGGEFVGDVANIGSACGTLYDYVRKVLRPGVEESPGETDKICVKFSYLCEDGMVMIGRRRVAFGAYENGIGLKELFAE